MSDFNNLAIFSDPEDGIYKDIFAQLITIIPKDWELMKDNTSGNGLSFLDMGFNALLPNKLIGIRVKLNWSHDFSIEANLFSFEFIDLPSHISIEVPLSKLTNQLREPELKKLKNFFKDMEHFSNAFVEEWIENPKIKMDHLSFFTNDGLKLKKIVKAGLKLDKLFSDENLYKYKRLSQTELLQAMIRADIDLTKYITHFLDLIFNLTDEYDDLKNPLGVFNQFNNEIINYFSDKQLEQLALKITKTNLAPLAEKRDELIKAFRSIEMGKNKDDKIEKLQNNIAELSVAFTMVLLELNMSEFLLS